MRDRAIILAFGSLAALGLWHCGGSSQPILPVVQSQANSTDTGGNGGNASSVSSASPSSQRADGGISNDGGASIHTDPGSASPTSPGATPQAPADPGQPAPQPAAPAPDPQPAPADPQPAPADPQPAAPPAECWGGGGPDQAGFFTDTEQVAIQCATRIKNTGGGSYARYGQVDCNAVAGFAHSAATACASGKNSGHTQAWVPGTAKAP